MPEQMRVTQAQLKAMMGKETFDKNGCLLLGGDASHVIGGGKANGASIRQGSTEKSSAAEKQMIADLLERAASACG